MRLRSQRISFRFGARLIDARLVQVDASLFCLRFQFSDAFARGGKFRDQPSAVLVQLRDLPLLDDQRLIGLSGFRLQLLDLLLMPARILIALFPAGIAEVLQ